MQIPSLDRAKYMHEQRGILKEEEEKEGGGGEGYK